MPGKTAQVPEVVPGNTHVGPWQYLPWKWLCERLFEHHILDPLNYNKYRLSMEFEKTYIFRQETTFLHSMAHPNTLKQWVVCLGKMSYFRSSMSTRSVVTSLHSVSIWSHVQCTPQALLPDVTTALTGTERALSTIPHNSCWRPPTQLQGKDGQSVLLLSIRPSWASQNTKRMEITYLTLIQWYPPKPFPGPALRTQFLGR